MTDHTGVCTAESDCSHSWVAWGVARGRFGDDSAEDEGEEDEEDEPPVLSAPKGYQQCAPPLPPRRIAPNAQNTVRVLVVLGWWDADRGFRV